MHKPVLVTGASSGIGEATAVFLAHKGFTVFAAARRIQALNELSALGGGRIHPIALDVTDPASIDAAIETMASGTSVPLYGLINNAGVSSLGPVEKVDIEEWRRIYDTNVLGTLRLIQKVLPAMRVQGAGRIVNISSLAGAIAPPFFGAYAASKHALEGMSDALRREVSKFGIRVSLVRPGFISTPIGEKEQESLGPYLTEDNPYCDDLQAFAKWHERGHPTGAPASEVAEAVHSALTARNPRARYTVPKKHIGSLTMNKLFPEAIIDGMLAKTTGLKK